MGTSIFEKLGPLEGGVKSGSLFGDTSLVAPTKTIPDIPMYDTPRSMGGYLGNLFELGYETMGKRLPKMLLTPQYAYSNEEKNVLKEGFFAMGAKVENALKAPINYLFTPSEEAESKGEQIAGDLKGLGTGVKESTVGLFSNLWSNPVETLSGLAQGIVGMTVEPVLTAITTKAIVGDEILDATPEEIGDAMLATAALPVSAGVYTKLANSGKLARAGLSANKAGMMSKAIGREYMAQVASGVVQEGLSSPEDISAEMIGRNIANPLLLLTSVGGGAGKYVKASVDNVNDWISNSAIINKDITVNMQSAMQATLNPLSSMSDALLFTDALTVSDNWIEAGARIAMKDKSKIFTLTGLTAEKADEIAKTFAIDKTFKKPEMQVGEGYVINKADGMTLYFKDSFDQYVATSGKSIDQLAKEFKLPRQQMATIHQNIADVIVEKLKKPKVQANFKFAEIPSVKLPDMEGAKLNTYKSDFNDVLITARELDKAQIEQFQKSGFFVGETVSVNGKQVKIEGISDSKARVVEKLEGTTTAKAQETIVLGPKKPKKILYQEKDKIQIETDGVERTSKRIKGGKVFWSDGFEYASTPNKELIGSTLAEDLFDPGTLDEAGRPVLLVKAKTKITEKVLKTITEAGLEDISIYTKSQTIDPGGIKLKIRGDKGKFKFIPREEASKISNGDITVWDKTTYNQGIINEFLAYADLNKNKSPFVDLIGRFVDRKARSLGADNATGWATPAARETFTQAVYAYLNDTSNPNFKVNEPLLQKWNANIEKEAKNLRQIAYDKLEMNGMRLEEDATKFRMIDMEGNVIANFSNLDEIVEFSAASFQNLNLPDLTAVSMAPNVSLESILPTNRNKGSLSLYKDRILSIWKQSAIANKLRRADRRVMDLAQGGGQSDIGAEIATKMDDFALGIDAMEQGPMKEILNREEMVIKKGLKLSPETRNQVTRVLEQKSHNELRAVLSNEEVALADALMAFFTRAGGMEKVLQASVKVRNGLKLSKLKDPALIDAVKMLDKSVKEGLLTDDRVLRYVHALDIGEDFTAAELMDRYNFTPEAREYVSELKEIYADARNAFGIEEEISGYSPHVVRFDRFFNQYQNVQLKDTPFIHEMRRVGSLPGDLKVTDSNELIHRYLKTGIHHTAPTAQGKTAAALYNEINELVQTLAESGVPVEDIQSWMKKFKGIPDPDVASELAFKKHFEDVFQKNIMMPSVDGVMDFVALTKLGFRPILALKDYVGTYGIGLLFGTDIANGLLDISPARRNRISVLQRMGELPQTESDALLSRTGRSVLSKVTDAGIKLSGQNFTYKMFVGNAYITAFDKSLKVMNQSKGNINALIEGLGDLLDSHPEPIQRYYLGLAQTDPIAASRFLGKSTAYAIANRFGRLHNPLDWQGTFGRAWGQIGSWNLNALTTVMESVNHSRSKTAAAGKLARMGLYSAGVATAAGLAGLEVSNWLVNPLTMIPGSGPIVNYYEDVRDANRMIFSGDEDLARRGKNLLEYSTKGFITPTMLRDINEGIKIMKEEEDGLKAGMRALGFRFQDEE